jgi:hypothetical protein
MPKRILNNDELDMPLARKAKPVPKPKTQPKREVFRQDFLLVKKGAPARRPKQKKPKKETYYLTMPVVHWKFSYAQLVGTALLFVGIGLGFAALSYLAGAKNDSKQILGIATDAYGDLNRATDDLQSQNFENAVSLFESAKANLDQASQNLNKYWLLTKVVPQARSADNVLQGAQLLAQAGQKLSSALSVYSQLKVSSRGVETANFAELLAQSKQTLQGSLDLLKQANSKFADAQSLPEEYQQQVVAAQGQIGLLTGLLQKMVDLEDLYLSFAGTAPKTYLLVFQNYDELRPTGGFIGTYGVLKLSSGAIKELKIESVYNLDGSLISNIAAPGPFQPDIKKWGLRDANWFADFPTTAQKLMYFYEKAKETTDGVIAITPKMFGQLLQLTGPIEMKDYGVTLTPDNFQDMVQLKTSVEYDKQLNQPKKFLADFAPILLDKLKGLNQDQWLQLMQIVNENFMGKNIMLYSADVQTQSKIEAMGFAGQISEVPHDYLSVVNANLGGTKTDLNMQQDIDLKTDIAADGSLVNTLTITRTNTAQEHNRDFMRVMVPLGSKVISSEGFDELPQFSSNAKDLVADPDLANWDKGRQVGSLFERTEAGKTEFTGWVDTPGIAVRKISITYSLPMKLDFGALSSAAGWSLLLQKQPGAENTTFHGQWNFAQHKLSWTSNGVVPVSGNAQMTAQVTSDKYWSSLWNE